MKLYLLIETLDYDPPDVQIYTNYREVLEEYCTRTLQQIPEAGERDDELENRVVEMLHICMSNMLYNDAYESAKSLWDDYSDEWLLIEEHEIGGQEEKKEEKTTGYIAVE